MTVTQANLVEPAESLRKAFADLVADYERAGEMEFVERHRKWLADFPGFVRHCQDNACGLDLPPGWVSGNAYWLVRDNRILGTCYFRPRLNDALRNLGGHIGYSVRPSERNKGYATLMLKMCLAKAREMGVGRVLITCDKDNLASVRVIEKNGGVLDSEGINPNNGKVTQRYWIDPGAGSAARGSDFA